jgi:hypothetical protein
MNATFSLLSKVSNETDTNNLSVIENFNNNVVVDAHFIFAIVTIIVVTPLAFGIIWYEKFGSDKKRTLINKLFSSFCFGIIAWNLIIQTFTVVRFIHGPYSG